VTHPGEKCKDFSRIFFKMVKNTEIFQSGEKCEDFSRWFHCNGQPAQMEDEKSFQRGLIMMGDLPR
jgi:hypothetical protein